MLVLFNKRLASEKVDLHPIKSHRLRLKCYGASIKNVPLTSTNTTRVETSKLQCNYFHSDDSIDYVFDQSNTVILKCVFDQKISI